MNWATKPSQVIETSGYSADRTNNLVLNESGSSALMISDECIRMINPISGKTKKIVITDSGSLHQVGWLITPKLEAIIVTTDSGFTLLSNDGESVIFRSALSLSPSTSIIASRKPYSHEVSKSFSRGFTVIKGPKQTSILAVGTSFGYIYLFELRTDGKVVAVDEPLTLHNYPITTLASSSSSSSASTQYLASTDEDGILHVWSVTFEEDSSSAVPSLKPLKEFNHWKEYPVLSSIIWKDLLVLGSFTGVIRIIHLPSLTLWAEVDAHTRPIYALSMHPTKPLLISASNDTTFCVWSLPTEKPTPSTNLSSIYSSRVEDVCLTGISFCGLQRSSIGAIGYDSNKLWLFHAEK